MISVVLSFSIKVSNKTMVLLEPRPLKKAFAFDDLFDPFVNAHLLYSKNSNSEEWLS